MIRIVNILAILFVVGWAVAAEDPVEPFWFVHITDSHIGVSGADEKLTATLKDILKHFPETELVINTGDLTDMGTEDQMTTYVQLVRSWPFPVYNASGNHDVRWSPWGKEKFKELVGPTYYTFRHKGVQFFFLDTSVLAEHHGHFSKEQLQWLDAELSRLSPETPVVICFHHPPLLPASTTDNSDEFAKIIERYNVPLVLVGHGHNLYRYSFNGTTYMMGGSTAYSVVFGSPCYEAFYVNRDGFLPYSRLAQRDKTSSSSLVPRVKPRDPYGELIVEEVKSLGSNSLVANCRITSIGKARLNKGSYEVDRAFRGVTEFRKGGRLSIPLPVSNPGRHSLTVTFVDDRKSTYSRTALFDIEPKRSKASVEPSILRTFDMPSTIQSSPVVDKNYMYVGCNDGTLRAFDLLTSELVWEAKLGAEILSTPAIAGDKLIVGSNDFCVYCFDKYTGLQLWKYRTGAAVLSTPCVDDDKVYVGSGDGVLYAFDVAKGKLLWTFKAEKMIKCKPAVSRGRVFFGAWDNWFYCVDTRTGQPVWKVPVSTTPQFSAATANPATTGTRVIFTSHDYCVRCLDQKTGAHLWMFKPPSGETGPSYSSFVFRGINAYSSSIAGTIVGFNMLTGERILNLPVRPGKPDELFDSAPVLDGKYLYVGSTGGNVYCVDLDAGQVVWSYSLQPGFIFATPAIWGDHLLVASMSGTVYELSRPEVAHAPLLQTRYEPSGVGSKQSSPNRR